MFRPFSLYLVMRNSRVRRRNVSGESTRCSSIWENGQNARKPPTITSYPPLMTAVTLPSTGSPAWAATSSASRACVPLSSLCDRRTSSPVEITVASISSPTPTPSLPSASSSSPRAIKASPLPRTSTKIVSAPTWMIRPFTTWPTSRAGPAPTPANSVAKSSGSGASSPSLIGLVLPSRQRRAGAWLRRHRSERQPVTMCPS